MSSTSALAARTAAGRLYVTTAVTRGRPTWVSSAVVAVAAASASTTSRASRSVLCLRGLRRAHPRLQRGRVRRPFGRRGRPRVSTASTSLKRPGPLWLALAAMGRTWRWPRQGRRRATFLELLQLASPASDAPSGCRAPNGVVPLWRGGREARSVQAFNLSGHVRRKCAAPTQRNRPLGGELWRPRPSTALVSARGGSRASTQPPDPAAPSPQGGSGWPR